MLLTALKIVAGAAVAATVGLVLLAVISGTAAAIGALRRPTRGGREHER